MQRISDWFRAWLRGHPILAALWVAFLALCLGTVIFSSGDDRPDVLTTAVILPLLCAVVILYFSRTVDRFKKIRELSGRPRPRRGTDTTDDV